MIVPHRAMLVNGDTIEYEGAHPTAWTTGGVDDSGKPNGTPVQTFGVLAYIPGVEAQYDDYGVDPRDSEIERLRKLVNDLRAKSDPRDAQIDALRKAVDELMGSKASDTKAELTPEEIAANNDALTEYKPGAVNDAV